MPLFFCPNEKNKGIKEIYTVAGKAIGFAPEQSLRVVALACSASGILK
jgi:hypothetical protein